LIINGLVPAFFCFEIQDLKICTCPCGNWNIPGPFMKNPFFFEGSGMIYDFQKKLDF
jgi:hypothetical protein